MPFTSDQLADRLHDARKTIDVIPAGADAHVIATIARAKTTDFSEAVDLIEQYAKVCAGDAVMKALAEAHIRTMAILEAPLTSSLP